jgi:hypothetical protein
MDDSAARAGHDGAEDGPKPRALARAEALDARDPLAAFRERFVIDDPELVYLDGNSLGRLPRATVERLSEVVRRKGGRRAEAGARMGAPERPLRRSGPWR